MNNVQIRAQSQNATSYTISSPSSDENIINQALEILARRITTGETVFDEPNTVKNYLIMRAAAEKDQMVERFSVLFLDAQNKMIGHEIMSTGTLAQTRVYPREVVRAVLLHNAAAVVLSHNHPSGTTQPSNADEMLTQTLKAALLLIDVRVLDHIITSGGEALSMAEKGLL